MFWVTLFMILASVDLAVLWFALAGSKRKDAPVFFEVGELPPDYAFKDY
jgi:hypothetical protein